MDVIHAPDDRVLKRLADTGPVILDAVQRAPDLLHAVKRAIDARHEQRGEGRCGPWDDPFAGSDDA